MAPNIRKLFDMIPKGKAGLTVKVVLGLAVSIWWSLTPGADEARCVG